MAQQDSTTVETPEPKKEKVKKPFKPVLNGIKIGTDLMPILFTAFDKGFTGGELNTELVFNNKFYINADFGFQEASRVDDDGLFTYNNSGSFWRVGIDYNLMHKTFSEQAIFIGTRFGNASFMHDADYVSSTTVWGDQQKNIAVDGLSISWMELNLGMKIKVVKNLYLSTIIRTKVRITNLDDALLGVGEMPGFGVNRNNITGAFSYRISYMLPIKQAGVDKPIRLKKTKNEKKELKNKKELIPTDVEEEEG